MRKKNHDRDYFDYLEDEHKVVDAFDEVCKHFGIETDEFYLNKESFRIVPTKTDNEKFATMMKKTNYGEFKKNSEPCKMWLSLTKDIEHFQKPKLFFYFDLLGHRWKERLFHIGEKLYCSIESDGDICCPDFVTELKAKSAEELQKELVSAKKELFNLRFQQATGNLEKPSRIRDLRHTVARMKTVLKEREVNE